MPERLDHDVQEAVVLALQVAQAGTGSLRSLRRVGSQAVERLPRQRARTPAGRSFLVSLTDASSAACISLTANPLSSTGGPVDPADDPSDPPLGAGRANAG